VPVSVVAEADAVPVSVVAVEVTISMGRNTRHVEKTSMSDPVADADADAESVTEGMSVTDDAETMDDAETSVADADALPVPSVTVGSAGFENVNSVQVV